MKALLLAALAIVATACAERVPTQYVGSVMNEAAPEAEGSLRLTLYARTDTSFAGVIELGAPARGTGGAYAWYEGPELHISSVGAESGDTIHWFSRLTDEGLGGRFEIIGGDRVGQEGTWRAHLVRGLPATPATLRIPPARPLPPLTALWPVLVLIVACSALARWILHAPPAPLPDGSPWHASASQLAGISGWLAFFAGAHVLGIVAWFWSFRSTWNDTLDGFGIAAALFGMAPLLVLELAITLLALPVTIGGLVLIARRSRFAPRYWFAYLGLNAVYAFVDLVAILFLHPQMRRLVGAEALAETGAAASAPSLARQLVVALIWMAYWGNARRVRATFGASALDSVAMVASSTSDASPIATTDVQAPRGRRRWLRTVLWGTGIVFGLLLVLLGYGLWATRASPYSVPEGTDIREAVAGRWSWASDTAGCRNAHTIAFAEGGKVMTITRRDTTGTDTAATYDILLTSRSAIRGAIRGETRMTDDGTPVVWDLVLTGPDEYRWKRTDWSASPWSYTGRIRRCPGPADASSPARSSPGG